MNTTKNRVDYFELKKRLKFINRPLFEFCGAYVGYLDSHYDLDQNDPKINKLCAKQLLYNEVMTAFDLELSPFVKSEIDAFDFCTILQSVLKAFLFDYQNINTFDTLLKKYDSFPLEDLFDFIGGCFINEYSQSNCDDWPSSDMEAMVAFIKEIPEVDSDARERLLNLYKFPQETKMRIRHVIVSMYDIFKKFESAAIEQSKKQMKRYANLMEIDYGYFCQILKFDDIAEVEYFKMYLDAFEADSNTVKYRETKAFKKLIEDEKAKQLTIRFYQYAKNLEFEKLFYFALTYTQQTVIIIITNPFCLCNNFIK